MAHFMKQNENAKDGSFYEAKRKRKGWTIVLSKTTSRSLLHKMVHPLLFRFALLIDVVPDVHDMAGYTRPSGKQS